MHKYRICVSLIENNPAAVKAVEPLVDLFEIRIDLIGMGWRSLVKDIGKPWIACCRAPDEGGQGDPDAGERIGQLFEAVETGAGIVDIEYRTPDLKNIVSRFKSKAKCLISFHDFKSTPPLDKLIEIVDGQIAAGADLCKVATTANKFEDNMTVLELAGRYSHHNIITFAMGEAGWLSRVMSPLCGAYLTYAAASTGKEAAAGQVAVTDLSKLYGYLIK
jgi:3-dehydroquinate dehydratase I